MIEKFLPSMRAGLLAGMACAAGCAGAAASAAEPASPEVASPEAKLPAESTPATSGAQQSPAAPEEEWEGEAEATASASATGSEIETRTTEVIAKIIKENRKPFRDCYEQGTKELPDLQGTLTLHFVLDPEGKVKLAELNGERSTIKAPPVVSCALAHLKSLKFPPSSRGMESTVNYPFDFKRR